MSAKDEVIKGSLKLKKNNGSILKKKKKKPETVDLRTMDISIKKEEARTLTKTELAFQKRQKESAVERLSKKAAVSHKERVDEFNKKMGELTEFYDIPKVSWTK
ncbi:hypothetical protein L596_010008 [Steinernema carpocapsae]|uniref:Protein FAM32A n=1 Tax=Steinernema carpocapsae TaxID=34508 RepID=A0A4U5PHI4_STECR|nr:hypothetical protein L596_010008 [Steinernema carpocapsae]